MTFDLGLIKSERKRRKKVCQYIKLDKFKNFQVRTSEFGFKKIKAFFFMSTEVKG